MFSGSVPTISSIQRTNVILVVVSAAILAGSPRHPQRWDAFSVAQS